MTTIREAKEHLTNAFRHGSHLTEVGFDVALPSLNDSSRYLIEAMHHEHGEVWLGNINLYEETRNKPVLWLYNPHRLVRNFEAGFVLSHYDETLAKMILERDALPFNAPGAGPLLTAIIERVREVGGEHLFWN